MQQDETKGKHLKYDDRCYIEDGLLSRMTFKEIATALGKDASTISKEVRKHRIIQYGKANRTGSDCDKAPECRKQHMCHKTGCDFYCATCKTGRCEKRCSDYAQTSCEKIDKPPYVCNACERKQICRFNKYYYRARHADNSYYSLLKECRRGIDLSPEDLDTLNKLVTPLIKNGQPVAHIYANHGEDIPCSRRTLYDYIDQGLLSAKNIDLPRKVRYKPRKKRREPPRMEPNYSRGRTYLDFNRYIENNPGISVVEMDTVEGIKGGKVLLTMFFRNSSLMLCFLLENLKQETFLDVFDWLYEELGEEIFQNTFPVILTDRGTEFQCPSAIEFDQGQSRRTKLFYCDPQCSWQKGALEKNHEFIRYVVPKGKPFDFYTQEDITLMANHINSLARDSLGGNTPLDLAKLLQNGKLMRRLKLKRIPPDEVYLKPGLLKKQNT